MSQSTHGRKRKAVTREAAIEAVTAPGDEFLNGNLDGILSASEDESYRSGSESSVEEVSEEEEEDEEDELDEEDDDESLDEDDEGEEDIRKQIRGLKM